MAFTEDKNILGSIRTDKERNPVSINSSTETADKALSYGSNSKFYELETGEVLDIVLDANHPKINEIIKQITENDDEVESGYTGWNFIGYAKIRLVNSETNIPYENLKWYAPKVNTIKKYPLLHELVIVGEYTSDKAINNHSARVQYYNPDPLNIYNSIVENSIPNVSIDNKNNLKSNNSTKSANQIQNYKDSETGSGISETFDDDAEKYNSMDSTNPNGDNLGNIFTANYKIHPLTPFEGDTIIEGRFGQSIRMSSTSNYAERKNIPGSSQSTNWWSEEGLNGDPILIIRNGESSIFSDFDVDTPIVEHFDDDGAVIILTAGQRIDFKPACDNMVTWQQRQPYTMYNSNGDNGLKTLAMDNYPFSGNQIMMASDRIVMNARQNEFIVYANGDIGFSTNGNFHINCKQMYINAEGVNNMTAASDGKADDNKNEPAVLGFQLTNLIQGIINRIVNLRFPGSPGAVDKITSDELQSFVKNEISNIISKQTYIKKEPMQEIQV